MEQLVLTRHRRCERCGERPATQNTDVCSECLADIEWHESRDYACDNEPTCAECGSVLSRNGHCFACLDRGVVFGPATLERVS